MSGQSELDTAILTSLILWPARQRDRIHDFARGTPASEGFQKHFAALYPHLRLLISDTEFNARWAELLAADDEHRGYRSWWRRLLTTGGIELDFVDREPVIALDAIERWERMLDRLDADALVTCALAERRRSSPIDDDVRALDRWTTVVKSSDRELETLWRRGVSDLHIHVGGVRFAQAAWFDFMDEQSDPASLKVIARQPELGHAIAAARAARERLWLRCGPKPEEEAPLEDREDHWWRWDRRRLLGERLLLARCWRASEFGDGLADLDLYLLHKAEFMRMARQPFETPPGLGVFSGYMSTLKTSTTETGRSGRLLMHPFGDALAFLAESPNLERVELRFDPNATAPEMGRAAEYFGHMVTAFNTARKQGPAALPPIDARMAFHLKRTRGKEGRAASLSALLQDIDRKTAALRLALADPTSGQSLRTWLARLDIAGNERNTSIIECAPYIRLAIGDDGALRDLQALRHPERRAAGGAGEGSQAPDPRRAEYANWCELVDQGAASASLSERRLGVTIHCGEDFADPLSGLHEIASAVDFVGLGPADGIGHGLALTTDAAAFMRDRGDHALIARGAHLDSLTWLVELMDRAGHRKGLALQHTLRACIENHAKVIYGERAGVQDIAWLRRARARCRPAEFGPRDGLRAVLWKTHANEDVRARMDQLISLPISRRDTLAVLPWAQRQVLKEIKARRIIVELNPSSNLRVSGAAAATLSPTVDLLLQADKGLLTSINTDNPGTFLSRIENEYALLLVGCRQRGVPEWQIRDLLERSRHTGREATYWPEREPQQT